ncbi:MAG: vitamin B12-dependent ribonucleotide reductase [bacterium]|nr:vitamin B12-dependent ribonucleotide reductase [bacterium]
MSSSATPAKQSYLKKENRAQLIARFFTQENKHPYDEITWERRRAVISNAKGETIFEQNDVEVPDFWSQTATDIVTEKYFAGHVGKPGRETSARDIVNRVADTITGWGNEYDYFVDEKEATVFNEELKWILINQYASFNSPIWFNVGVTDHPQCSACFILSVDDNKESIVKWYRDEMFIFSGGSGSGVNVSNLRSSQETISGRGKSSGPVSFMKGADAIAGTIKSGGKTRRAAKMVVMNADHPDIREFITCKWKEEEKAKALIGMGYDDAIDGAVYNNIFFQNANNSVRVTDEFMEAAANNGAWELKSVKDGGGEVLETTNAKDILHLIAEASWHCADPGVQYDTTINRWHTASVTGRINASNPCSEYMHLDNSACNLASLNLMKYRKEDGSMDVSAIRAAVRTMIVAMDITVAGSAYPTEEITKNAKDFRELGLGYANIGALLMSNGLPYDSDDGRALAGALTALMTGEAYLTSTHLTKRVGTFAGFQENRRPMLKVLRMHRDEVENIDEKRVQDDLMAAAATAWDKAVERSEKFGVRNSQTTVLAPTGTIAFMMDCDTTGVEPDFSLVKYKKMVGGGFLKIVNQTVPLALKTLGYDKQEVEEIISYIEKHDMIEGAPGLKDEHLAVFDCATNASGGTRSIHYMGHLRMMAAAQPFISGAISKTVNLPESVSIDDIMNVYTEGWKMGLKAIAVYRDGSKGAQPLNTKRTKSSNTDKEDAEGIPEPLTRKILPHDVVSYRHKFSVMGHEGYIHYGLYPDGSLGEVFIRMAKEGSTISGLLDSIGVLLSVSLQYGVPVKTIVRKFVHTRFEPAGFTENPDIPAVKSILDYIAKFLALKFLTPEEQRSFGIYAESQQAEGEQSVVKNEAVTSVEREQIVTKEVVKLSTPSYQDAPACRCGAIMVRTGSCYTCRSCGANLGACG